MTRIQLFIIDPQNDFMDLAGSALPVSGAVQDMRRLSGFIDAQQQRIDDLIVTLDSHASVGIERTTFWTTGDGTAVPPFTVVTAADVRAGRFLPRNAALRPDVLTYLDALQAGGRRTLVVWPVHCVVGHWGHNIETELGNSIVRWECARLRQCEKVQKGHNPLTEQYSAFRAEVPRGDDQRTHNNSALMRRLEQHDGLLVVAGEALSHCVAASGQDMLDQLPARRLCSTVFLTDCMSPVAGFEPAGQDFLATLRSRGVRTMSVAELSATMQA